MAYNLSRNSRLFLTTNLNTATGAVLTTGFTGANCWELNILDGFNFSQNTNQTTISINEAGNTPVRGSRAFNTALNPVEISFSTYIRPKYAAGITTADEKQLWNALFGYVGIDGSTYNDAGVLTTNNPIAITGAATLTRTTSLSGTVQLTGATITGAVVGTWYNLKNLTAAGGSLWEGPAKLTAYTAGGTVTFSYATPPAASAGTTMGAAATGGKLDKAAWVNLPTHAGRTTACGLVSSAASNKNTLLPIGFIFIVDNVSYAVSNAAMDSATIDFGLDAIAMVAWTAKGTKLTQLASNVTAVGGVLTGGVSGNYTPPVADAQYITNKLSTMTLASKLYGSDGTAGTPYSVVLTGGSMQIQNNINYVTPSNLGIVNEPIGYFTGARAISGTVNAYLRTGTSGTNDAGKLLSDMLANITTAAETKYRMQIEVGGLSNPTRVELDVAGAVISIPSVDVQDVVSTTISFNAQAASNDLSSQTYDIENTNDLFVRYFSA